MVKHTLKIRRLLADKLSLIDHFVWLALKGLIDTIRANDKHSIQK